MDTSSKTALALFAASLIYVSTAQAELRDFQTTRLVSTAGTGVGSILMDEGTILNPAPLAFFTTTSFYVQKNNSKYEYDKNDGSSTKQTDKMNNWGFIASDGNGQVGASLSYQTQKIGDSSRKRWGLAMGMHADKDSAVGIAVKRTVDEISSAGQTNKDTLYQFNAGVTHVMSPSLTLGLLASDVTKKVQGDTAILVGIQYVYAEFISLLADAGTNYTQSFTDYAQYHGAAQFKVFSDVYLRVGAYENKAKHERGTGGGIGWVGPKLVFEAGIANKKLLAFKEVRARAEEAKEASFSLSLRF